MNLLDFYICYSTQIFVYGIFYCFRCDSVTFSINIYGNKMNIYISITILQSVNLAGARVISECIITNCSKTPNSILISQRRVVPRTGSWNAFSFTHTANKRRPRCLIAYRCLVSEKRRPAYNCRCTQFTALCYLLKTKQKLRTIPFREKRSALKLHSGRMQIRCEHFVRSCKILISLPCERNAKISCLLIKLIHVEDLSNNISNLHKYRQHTTITFQ